MHADPTSLQELVSKESHPSALSYVFCHWKALTQKEPAKSNTENRNGCALSTILHLPLPLLHDDAGLDVSVNQHLQESILLLNWIELAFPTTKGWREKKIISIAFHSIHHLKYHFLHQLLEGDSSKTPQVRPQILKKNKKKQKKIWLPSFLFFLALRPVSSQITVDRLSLPSSLEHYRLNWPCIIPPCGRNWGISQPDEILHIE